MSETGAIDRYVNRLQRLGDLAEHQFLKGRWQEQRQLPALALEEADRLVAEAKSAAEESYERPVRQAHVWACSVISRGAADGPAPGFDSVPRTKWRRLESWGEDQNDPVEQSVAREPFLMACQEFAEGKGLHLGPEAEYLPLPFFRNRRAYYIARTSAQADHHILLLALTSENGPPELDAVLHSEKEVTPVFEFSRSILTPRWSDPLEYLPGLEELLPNKPRWQLLLNTGFSVLGQAVLLAELQHHLELEESAQFEQAPGTPGMVMIVFHLPSFPIVFKVIKDQPDPPKEVGRREVLRKYRLVAEHDRVGRLADSNLFRELRLPRAAFEPTMLKLLQERAGLSLRNEGDFLVFRDVLVERRMMPLDLLLHEDEADWPSLLEEFADAIRDLAQANVFPGDLLPKNFGVTAFGRVVFYDYDDVDLLTSLQFRRLPDDEDAILSLGPNDVFPEEWPRFLFQSREHRDYLCQQRPEIFDPMFWKSCRDHYQSGDSVDLFPYQSQRT